MSPTGSVSITPVKEVVQNSPTRYSSTMWYKEGSPMLVEEYIGEELLEGQYYTLANDVESKVQKGTAYELSATPSALYSLENGLKTATP